MMEHEEEKKKDSNSKNKIMVTESDIVLDIPEFEYVEVKKNLRKLDAHVSVDASLGKLVKVQVGAEAEMEKVDLEIKNVNAEAHLIINLDKINEILNIIGRAVEKNHDFLKPLLVPISEATGVSLDKLNDEVLEALTGIDTFDKKVVENAIITSVKKTVKESGNGKSD